MTEQEMEDAAVRDQVMTERVKRQLVNEYTLAVLAALMSGFQNRINALSVDNLGQLNRRQLNSLLNKVAFDISGVERSQRVAVIQAFEDFAAIQSQFAAGVTGVDRKLIRGSRLIATATDTPLGNGQTLDSVLKAWAVAHTDRALALIRRGSVESLTPSDLISTMRGTRKNKFKDGLLAQTERNIITTVNTATQHVSMVALSETWGDEFTFYRWVSVLDSRTSPVCRSLAGQVFEFGKGPMPPQHPNCRSTIAPLRSRSKPKPSPTYYDWLKTQPKSFQDSVLGVKRAKLFREGNLSATEFAELQLDKNFKPMTLEEMRREVPSAFEAAGLDD